MMSLAQRGSWRASVRGRLNRWMSLAAGRGGGARRFAGIEMLEARQMLSAAYTLTDLGTLGGDTSDGRFITQNGRVWVASGDVDADPGQLNAVFSFQDLNGNHQLDNGERALMDFSSVAPLQFEVWGADPISPLPTITGSIVFAEQGSLLTSAYIFRDLNINSIVDPGEFMVIGDPSEGARGTGVNASGMSVGTAYLNNHDVAYLYQDLNNDGNLDTGELLTIELAPTYGSEALGINLAGRIVGSGYLPNESKHAFIFDDLDEDMQVDSGELVDLHNTDYLNSVAVAVNEQGVVTGYFTDSLLANTGFIFNDRNNNRAVDAGEMLLIPGSAGMSVTPKSINNQGVVVGQMSDINANTYGFVYDPVNGLRLLSDLVNQPDVVVIDATSINDSGRIVVTTHDLMQQGGPHASLLSPTQTSAPRATIDNAILLADASGQLRAFDITDGSTLSVDGLTLGTTVVPLLVRASDGRVILIDSNTGAIQRLTTQAAQGVYMKETLWTGAQSGLVNPTAATVGPDGSLYVANGDGDIIKFNISTLSAPSVFIANDPQVDVPSALLWNSQDQLLVALPNVNLIRRYDSNGSVIDDFSNSARGGFTSPSAMALTPWGELLVAGSTTNSVVALDASNGQLRRLLVSAQDNSLVEPRGIALLPDGRLLVTSRASGQVLEFDGRSGQYLGVFAEGSPDGVAITNPVNLLLTNVVPPVLVGGTELLFYVQFNDELGIDPATLDDDDMTVTGPGGIPISVQLVAHNAAYPTSPVIAVYRMIAPGGTWTINDNGLYTITFAADSVANTEGSTNPSDFVLMTTDISITQTYPIAELINEIPQTTVAATWDFTVVYSESTFVDSAFDSNNIRVTGPGGFDQMAEFVEATINPYGAAIVTYRLTAPDDWFDNNDNGQYTVTLLPNQVFDTAGVPVPGGALGNLVLDTVKPRAAFDADALIGSTTSDEDYFRFSGVIGSLQGAFLTLSGNNGTLLPGRGTLGPDGKLYVINRSNNSIERFDAVTGQWISTFVAAGSGGLAQPTFVLFGPDGNLYVGDRTANAVLRYNGQTGAFLNEVQGLLDIGLNGPSDGAFSPDGLLYVASESNSRILRIDPVTGQNGTIVMNSADGLAQPCALAFGADGRLYIGNVNNTQIDWYNPDVDASGVFIANAVASSGNPVFMAFAPDGRLLVSNGSGQFKAFDGTTGTLIESISAAEAIAGAGYYFNLPKITPYYAGSTTPMSFWVSFSDAAGIDTLTLDGDELQVRRPDGSTVLASVVSYNANIGATRVLVQYSISPIGSTWSSPDVGVYQFRILSNGVSDITGNGTAAALLASFDLSLDTSPPTVLQVSAANVVTANSDDFIVTVTYQDDRALDPSRFSTDDLRLVGPGYSNAPASIYSVGNLSPGKTRVVQYLFTAPAGGFSVTNNGTFVAQFQADAVYDISSNALQTVSVDAFTVDIPIINPPDPYIVTTTSDSGEGSLRWAIVNANDHSGADIITFNIPGSGLQTISLSSPLPAITDTLTINGYSQTGATPNSLSVGSDAIRLIRLLGDDAGSLSMGLVINAPSSTITGLIVQGFSGAGIYLASNANSIHGNFITGNGAGVWIAGSDQNIIGGTTAADRNVISGNVATFEPTYIGDGIVVAGSAASDNVIQGNYIGVAADGDTPSGNAGSGIFVRDGAVNTIIGGDTPGKRNVISSNSAHGIALSAEGTKIDGNYIGLDANGSAAMGNLGHGIIITGTSTVTDIGSLFGNVISSSGFSGILVAGETVNDTRIFNNFIGTDVTGTLVRGNHTAGIFLSTSADTTIGNNLGDGNLISSNNGYGVYIGDGANGVTIQGNRIGTDFYGTAALPNTMGVLVDEGAANIVIGTATTGNVISGNSADGVKINANVTNASISSNIIGLASTGSAALPNQGSGIVVLSPVTIGGVGAGNVISGNRSFGVFVDEGGQNTTIRGNIIGGVASGDSVRGNDASGIYINTNTSNVTIGGTQSGEGNLIVGNLQAGIVLAGNNNSVLGNLIGTDASLTLDLGNGTGSSETEAGIVIAGSGNVIGATPANPTAIAAAGVNAILFNDGQGIEVDSGNNNLILFNIIHSNTDLGIDLGNHGVTANDSLDADTGANDLQNYPVLFDATFDADGLTVYCTFNSLPDTSYTIQFFANVLTTSQTNGPSEMYLGQQTVTTDPTGLASFIFSYGSALLPNGDSPLGSFITATAIYAGNTTSEFSARRVVVAGAQSQPPQAELFAEDITISRSPSHTFVVHYTSEVGIDLDSIDDSDILVSGVSFNQLATFIDAAQDGETGDVFVTYRINNNSGRTLFRNQPLTVSLASNQVFDGQDTAALPQVLGVINTPDIPESQVGPTAKLKVASSLTTPGIDGLIIRVTYADDDAIPVRSSLGTGDLRVYFGEGDFLEPTLLDSDFSADGTRLVATYLFASPTPGGFTSSDNGTYQIRLMAGEVSDSAGGLNEQATLGSFTVNVVDAQSARAAASGKSLSFGRYIGRSKHAMSLNLLTDGGAAIVKLQGPGSGQLVNENGVTRLVVTGTDARSSLTISGAGAAAMSLDEIFVEGSLRQIVAGDLSLTGGLHITGSVNRIKLGNVTGGAITIDNTNNSRRGYSLLAGDVSDVNLTSNQRIDTLRADQWLDTGGDAETIQAPSIRRLIVPGALQAGVSLQSADVGAGASLGLARIGSVGVSAWSIAGRARDVSIGAASPSWNALFSSGFGRLRLSDDVWTNTPGPVQALAELDADQSVRFTLTPVLENV